MRIISKESRVDASDAFLCTVIVYHDGNNFYVAESSDFFPEDIEESNILGLQLNRTLIPHEHIFPMASSPVSVVNRVSADVYVKQPDVSCYNAKYPSAIPNRFLQEVQLMEELARSPHPNIVRYYGCRIESGRILGICLENCVDTLYERTWLKKCKVDIEAVLKGIREGIDHLHKLGYCHNDVSIHNIMLREDNTVVVIDFDSCQPTGHELGRKTGTPGFFNFKAKVSDPQNDYFSIDRVESYLLTGKLPFID